MTGKGLEEGTQGWWFEGRWWVRDREIKRLDGAAVGGRVTNCDMWPNPTRWNPGAKPDLRDDTRHWLLKEAPDA